MVSLKLRLCRWCDWWIRTCCARMMCGETRWRIYGTLLQHSKQKTTQIYKHSKFIGIINCTKCWNINIWLVFPIWATACRTSTSTLCFANKKFNIGPQWKKYARHIIRNCDVLLNDRSHSKDSPTRAQTFLKWWLTCEFHMNIEQPLGCLISNNYYVSIMLSCISSSLAIGIDSLPCTIKPIDCFNNWWNFKLHGSLLSLWAASIWTIYATYTWRPETIGTKTLKRANSLANKLPKLAFQGILQTNKQRRRLKKILLLIFLL